MDFIQQFIAMALGRMTSGGTSAQADTSGIGGFFGMGALGGAEDSGSNWSGMGGGLNYHGLGLSSLQSVNMAYQNVEDPNLTGRQKAQRVAEGVGKLVGDWYTGGNVSPFTNWMDTNHPEVRDWVEKIDLQLNPAVRLFGHLFKGKGGKGLSFF